MKNPLTTAEIESMRRAAKKLARAEGIAYSHALDRFAQTSGYNNWSLLQKAEPGLPSPFVFRRDDEQMAQALRVVPAPDPWRVGSRDETVRAQTNDIASKFVTAANAVDFAIAYMDAILRRKRFRIDTRSIAYFEMRSWLPYGAESVDGSTRILVNRDYKPVGATSKDHFQYEQFTNLHAVLEPSEFHAFTWPGATQAFLYYDACPPWASRISASNYRDRLHRLRGLLP